LGQTRGFKRNGGKYYPNNVPKTIWVRILVPNACRLLADPVPHPELLPTEVTMNLDAVALETSGGLLEYLNNVPDFRKKRGIRHRLLSVLAVAVCAILSGARSYVAMGQWAQNASQKIRQRLGCRYHKKRQCFVAPSEPTLRRAIQQVEAEPLEQAVSAWLTAQVNIGGQAIAIDGKTLRGAKDKNGHQTHLLSAFLHNQGLVLAQREVPSKSNEIPTVRPLLELLAIAGCVVTADALHTQKETARFLVEEKHADYLFTVKDNQATLKQDIADLDWTDFPPSA